MRPTALAPICFAILTLASCKGTKTFSTDGGSVTIEQKAGATSSTVMSKDGKVVTMYTTPGKIPGDYPSDMPIYPGAKTNLSQTVPQQHMLSVALESEDPMEKITEFYRKGLESNGWTMDSTTTGDNVIVLSAMKENRQASVTVINAGDRRSITQVLLPR